jgi:hypothetical protein
MAYKQHFIEWFSGKQLPSYWTQVNSSGTGTFTMEDSVDGGFSVIAQSGGYNFSFIYFNNKRQYAHNNSTAIYASKFSVTSGISYGWVGLTNDGNGGITASHSAMMGKNSSEAGTNFGVYTRDGTTASQTLGSVAQDTSYHTFKGVLDGTDYKFYLDGVLEVTKTTNLPTVKMQPTIVSWDNNAGNPVKINTLYCEAYNT